MPAPPVERMLARLDGRTLPLAEARLPLVDHGFLYGDSVYETLRTHRGRIFRLDRHLERLRRSARGLRIPMPWSDGELQAELEDFRSCLEGREHYLRLIVSRGSGELSYTLDERQAPRLILLGGEFVPVPEEVFREGLQAVVVRTRRSQTLDPGLKTGNLLHARLAYLEAREAGADEAILLNPAGDLAESTSSNLFLVLEGDVLATPSLDSGILDGVTRKVVLELARGLALEVRDERLPAGVLETATEAFLTSTTRSIAPIRELDHRPLKPVPGPVTARLMAAFIEQAGAL